MMRQALTAKPGEVVPALYGRGGDMQAAAAWQTGADGRSSGFPPGSYTLSLKLFEAAMPAFG